jgi:uncharacterized protein
MTTKEEYLNKLPGSDCGICMFRSCEEFAEELVNHPDEINRCLSIGEELQKDIQVSTDFFEEEISWKDHLDREYDFILDKFPGELGPRETIILFNPANVEKLQIKKGDILYGRPAWISCGCPVTHVGMVVEEPDYFNGTVVWQIVGPMMARERGINIGYYNTTSYEGIVKNSRKELKIGMRYYFLPRYCMLQWRHCGLVNQIARSKDGLHVRIEGLWIG